MGDAVACLQGSSEVLGDLEKHCDYNITDFAGGLIQPELLACLREQVWILLKTPVIFLCLLHMSFTE